MFQIEFRVNWTSPSEIPRRLVMNWIVSPQIRMVKPSPPELQKMVVFGHWVFQEGIKVK